MIRIVLLNSLLIFSMMSMKSAVDSEKGSEDQVTALRVSELGLPANLDADSTLVAFVYEWIGTKYCYGGSSRKGGVDCSGFANILYSSVYQVELDRVSTVIHKNSKKVKRGKLKQGDLVFFHTLGKKHVNHVGVYLWDGNFVHASSKRGVIISTINEGYYDKNFVSGGRVN